MKQNCNNCIYHFGNLCVRNADMPINITEPAFTTCSHQEFPKIEIRNDKGWGGSRQGSGRKPTTQDGKRVQVVITIDMETRNRLKSICKARGVKMGRLIDEMVGGEW